MSDSTGAAIGMTAGAIAFGNEWYVSNSPNWRIAVATPLASLFLYGIGKISSPISTGLGLAMLVTVLLTPFKGKSPLQTVGVLGSKTP